MHVLEDCFVARSLTLERLADCRFELLLAFFRTLHKNNVGMQSLICSMWPRPSWGWGAEEDVPGPGAASIEDRWMPTSLIRRCVSVTAFDGRCGNRPCAGRVPQ